MELQPWSKTFSTRSVSESRTLQSLGRQHRVEGRVLGNASPGTCGRAPQPSTSTLRSDTCECSHYVDNKRLYIESLAFRSVRFCSRMNLYQTFQNTSSLQSFGDFRIANRPCETVYVIFTLQWNKYDGNFKNNSSNKTPCLRVGRGISHWRRAVFDWPNTWWPFYLWK